MSTSPVTLDSLYGLLSGFIHKQEAFNTKVEAFMENQETFNTKIEAFVEKQEAFNSKQEAFNSKQEAFNSKQELCNARQELFNTGLEARLDTMQESNEQNHNLTHRMILQSYQYINDIREEMDDQDQKNDPWIQKTPLYTVKSHRKSK
jgi:vacuolar-type H+-ATPase subunit I/STV1